MHQENTGNKLLLRLLSAERCRLTAVMPGLVEHFSMSQANSSLLTFGFWSSSGLCINAMDSNASFYIIIGGNSPGKQETKVQHMATQGSCMLPPVQPWPSGMPQVRTAVQDN